MSTLQDTVEGDTYLIDNQDDTLIFYTNLDAPNGKVVGYNTQSQQWTEIIAEQEQPLDISKGGGYLFATYMVDVLSKVQQFTYQGSWYAKSLYPIKAPYMAYKAKQKTRRFIILLLTT